MSEGQCSCAKLERLEGASVPAYICAYLEQSGHATPEEMSRYRCRICGEGWEKRWPEKGSDGKRPSLIRNK
jgi:hypothetical protein